MFSFLKRKKRFGEIAVDKGLVSKCEVETALRDQNEYATKHKIHKEIGAILTEKGILTPNDVKMILDEQKDHIGTMAWFTTLFNLNR